ncbi:MAG: YraN family protein [Cyclobacteriaceae bacterium]|nr:YraN family protein [Cyclobacteriaceae bacterium]
MGNNIKSGQEGERLAAEYLQKNGFFIRETNYRAGKSEIDIIATKGELLVFVEVKLRKNADFGYPEEAVNEKKWEKITEGAEVYLEKCGWQGMIRFDIISILRGSSSEITHIEDAFG